MCPEVVVVKRRESWCCISYEAASRVCVHAEEKRNEEMVGVPEGFEGLLSDPVVSGRVHQKHEQKHHMSSNSTCLGVVDLECNLWSHLRSFNVEKAATWLA
jgi:hypothetical protein